MYMLPYSGKLSRSSRFQNHPRKCYRRNFARSVMRTLRVRGCVAHARRPHLHVNNNWSGAIRERFLSEILPKRESFLPRNFSAIGIPFFYFYVTHSSTSMRAYICILKQVLRSHTLTPVRVWCESVATQYSKSCLLRCHSLLLVAI